MNLFQFENNNITCNLEEFSFFSATIYFYYREIRITTSIGRDVQIINFLAHCTSSSWDFSVV